MMTSEERRQKFRLGLSPLYLPVYDTICSLLPGFWAPFYGLRTFDQQTGLYAFGRTTGIPGKTVTDAKAGESPHNYGCASDWIVWNDMGQPIWMGDKDPRWQVYEDACSKSGAIWGGNFHKTDKPHNELHIECDWKQALAAFNQNGMTAAQQFIEKRMVR